MSHRSKKPLTNRNACDQILTSYVSNTTNLPLSSSRRSLKQLLADFHTFDCHIQRQYRTIGIGDNDVNANISTTNINKSDLTTQNMNILHDESEIPLIPKLKARRTSIERKKTPNIITRTICTRSSKLNTLNNNQEPLNHALLPRARKRRSSFINNTNTHTQINTVHNTMEKSDLNLNKLTEEEASGVRVSRKKLQSSVECSNTANDF